MTRTLSVTAKVVAVALAILAVYVFAFGAQADTRDASVRDRGGSGSPSTDSPPSTPTPSPTNPNVGNISNSTSGTADSGGNEGGTVITGDEHVEVYVVNIGPTNTPDTGYGGDEGGDDPTPEPESQCDRRASPDCPIQDSGRDR